MRYFPYKHGSLINFIVFVTAADSDQEEVEQIVNKLTKLTDKVHFKSTDIETDGDGECMFARLFFFTSLFFHISCASYAYRAHVKVAI